MSFVPLAFEVWGVHENSGSFEKEGSEASAEVKYGSCKP